MVSKRVKEAFEREARSLQRDVRDAVHTAAESTRGSFAGVPGAVDKSLGVIIGRAVEIGKSTRPEAFSSHTANRDAYADAFGSRTRPTDVLHAASIFNSPGAQSLCVHSFCGA